MRGFSTSIVIVAVLLISACNAYGPKPTPAQSPTPKPTVLPKATVGPLNTVDIDKPGLTLRVPSTWKTAMITPENGIILSPDGSTDTSATAEAFLLVLVGDSTFFRNKMSFRADLTDPVEQLAAMLRAINRDSARFATPVAYQGAEYPAAITTGFERDNQLTIILMNAGNDRWIYVGAQSPEVYFKYYEDTVFKPATDSLSLKAP